MGKSRLPRGIRRRGEKFLVNVYHNGKRKYVTCETLVEAMEKQAELKEAMLSGNAYEGPQVQSRVPERAPEDTWTLQEAVDRTHTTYWKRDEWFYVGIVVSVEYNGVLLDDHIHSVWGYEANFPNGDNSYLTEEATRLMEEALDDARKVREEMIARLIGKAA